MRQTLWLFSTFLQNKDLFFSHKYPLKLNLLFLLFPKETYKKIEEKSFIDRCLSLLKGKK